MSETEFDSFVKTELAEMEKLVAPAWDTLIPEAKGYRVNLIGNEAAQNGLGALIDILEKIQGYKDRLSTIICDAIHYRATLSRIYDNIKHHFLNTREDIINKKSSELREATINDSISGLVTVLRQAEMYEEVLNQVWKNLVSANDNASRQLSVVECQIKLMEIGTGRRGGNGGMSSGGERSYHGSGNSQGTLASEDSGTGERKLDLG